MTGRDVLLLAVFVLAPMGCFVLLIVGLFFAGVVAGALSATAP